MLANKFTNFKKLTLSSGTLRILKLKKIFNVKVGSVPATSFKLIEVDNNLAEMPSVLHALKRGTRFSKGERSVNDRTHLIEAECGIHRFEHFTAANVDSLHV